MNQPFGKYYKKDLMKEYKSGLEWLSNDVTYLLYNYDYEKVIRRNLNKDAFWFIDPPYKTKLGYPNIWTEADFDRLFGNLKKLHMNKWMMIVPEDQQVNDEVELNDYRAVKIDTRYKRYTKGKDNGRKKLLMVMNY